MLASALQALVNASAEELLWCGTYLAVFAKSPALGYLYPTVGFVVWHYTSQVVFPSRYPGEGPPSSRPPASLGCSG